MKCTNCGKNNASYHYKYNINGNVTEAHLCPDCAAKLAPEKEFAARTNSMFRDFFNDSFFGDSFLDDGFFGNSMFGQSPMRSMFAPIMTFGIPAMLMPGMEIRYTHPGQVQETGSGEIGSDNNVKVDPELSRKREINALRHQMKAAAKAEDYEKAAELRDKLRELEKGE